MRREAEQNHPRWARPTLLHTRASTTAAMMCGATVCRARFRDVLFSARPCAHTTATARAFASGSRLRRLYYSASRLVLGLLALVGLACSGAPAPASLAVVPAAPTAETPAEPMRWGDWCATYEKSDPRWWLTLDGGTSAPSDGGSH
jgi:hypothetical protein